MKKKFNIKIIIFFVIIIIISIYFATNFIIQGDKFHNLKSLISNDTKRVLKKYIFPYKLISFQEELIARQKKTLAIVEPYLMTLEIEKKKVALILEL